MLKKDPLKSGHIDEAEFKLILRYSGFKLDEKIIRSLLYDRSIIESMRPEFENLVIAK